MARPRDSSVIDRAVQRLADGLDLVQRDRRAPGDALGVARLANFGRVAGSSGMSASAAASLTSW